MNIDKLKQKIDNLSEENQLELFDYIYDITINKMDNKSIMNVINSCEQTLRDRSFLIDNFNGNDVKDFVLHYQQEKIKCRLHSNGIILGMTDRSEFIIGSIDNNMNIYLLKQSSLTNTIHSFEGNFENFYIFGRWFIDFNDALKYIFMNSENPLYDQLPSKKIDGFTLILKELYNKQPNKFKEIIQNIVNKYKSINHFKTKTLN